MARRRLEVLDIMEIYEHWQAGRGPRSIARSLGVDRNTVRKYIEIAEKAGISQTGPKLERAEWVSLVHEKVKSVDKQIKRGCTEARIAPYHEEIKRLLKETSGKTIWGRLCREKGLEVSYTSFKRYLRKHFAEEQLRKRVTVRRDDPGPGEEVQIDFGRLGYWLNPETGKKQLLSVFAMTLSLSRHMFIRVVERLDLVHWIESHIRAFEFFEGVPERWVVDNLKDGVVKADLYDPKLNRTYGELASHYEAVIDPCRSGKPKDKPRVERSIPYIRDSFYSGREFRSVEEMNEMAIEWCLHIAGQRDHGTTHLVPAEVFRLVEQKELRPLPNIRFEMSQWFRPKVHQDAHICVGGALYSVNWKNIGSLVDVRLTSKKVEIYKDERLIKTHSCVGKGKRQTDLTDYPSEKVRFYQRTPDWCLTQAAKLGPSIYQVIEELLKNKAFHHLRQSQRIIRLSEKYGNERLEAACQRALYFGDPAYRTIRTILETGRDRHLIEEREGSARSQKQLPGAYLRGVEEIITPQKTGCRKEVSDANANSVIG